VAIREETLYSFVKKLAQSIICYSMPLRRPVDPEYRCDDILAEAYEVVLYVLRSSENQWFTTDADHRGENQLPLQNAVLPVLTLLNIPASAIFSIKPNSA
jgi:hypothetical protein